MEVAADESEEGLSPVMLLPCSLRADYYADEDDEFDVVMVNASSGVSEDLSEPKSAASQPEMSPPGLDDGVIYLPDARETIELYAWNVIIGMVCAAPPRSALSQPGPPTHHWRALSDRLPAGAQVRRECVCMIAGAADGVAESEFVEDADEVDFKNMKLSSGTAVDLSQSVRVCAVQAVPHACRCR